MSDARSSKFDELLVLLNSRLRWDELIPSVLDACLELTGAERSFLLIQDAAGGNIVSAGRNNRKQCLSESDFQLSGTIVKKVLETKTALFLPKLEEAPEFASTDSVRLLNLQSAACIPLLAPGSVEDPALGALYIDASTSSGPLTESETQILQMLGSHVAVCLQNASLFEQLQRKNKEILALNQKLQQRVEDQAGNLAEMQVLLRETQRELRPVYGLGNIVGQSPAMLKVFKILEKVVNSEATVLILGESGTGKELAARYIHYNGPRSERAMVSINCSAFNEALLESELFGHRKGAFTGAHQNKAGLFALADEGTLFLDEIGDMSLEMQKKLLRTLQGGEFWPVGDTEPRRVNVRIIAATHQDLHELVRQSKFREDLYYRLNVISISIPPLRERVQDLPLLIDFLTHRLSEEWHRSLPPLSNEILQNFLTHSWPGNVRELENELRKVYILDTEYQWNPPSPDAETELHMSSVERSAILKALEAAHGNKRKAAELLGMPRSTFYIKLSRYGIF